ncbi:MAG: Zn-ribbon domain-containing OB-fold protein [Parasphingopyxis sp.]|uniref:Zn-ribbon domain-containing OB-fold protein n=1 Tax=Parasphingopyxis sp. TaxID=1920299 RepID=UPI003F9F220E
MADTLEPIAPGLWTDGAEPQLIGGRRADGEIVFPMPDGDAAEGVEPVALSRTGTLWSWTRQDFRPKTPPYEGPEEFEPFLLGYVELPGEVIVETRIVDATLEELELGMPMELAIVPFDGSRSTFAFRPENSA